MHDPCRFAQRRGRWTVGTIGWLQGFLILVAGCAVQAEAAAFAIESDTQVWSEVDASTSVAPDTRLTLSALGRAGERLPNPTVWGVGASVDFMPAQWLSLTAGDLFLQARSAASGARIDVQAPSIAGTLVWHGEDAVLSDRNRVEQLFGAPGNPWRYRNRLLFEEGVSTSGILRAVFASDEVFYDQAQSRWTRNRALAGIDFAPLGRTTVELYVLRQRDSVQHPGVLNVLGVTLKIDVE